MPRKVIRARPFDFPHHGSLNATSMALLVIDMQLAFLAPDGYLARKGYDPAPLRAILPAVNGVIDAARAAGCFVIHTRQGYRADMAYMTGFLRDYLFGGRPAFKAAKNAL